MDESPVHPACQRCRSRKNKCDRKQPRCSRCAKTNAECVYQSRHSAAVFTRYCRNLEEEIARLECELGLTEESDFLSNETATAEEDIIFSSPDFDLGQYLGPPCDDEELTSLVKTFSNVSLSATTAQLHPLPAQRGILLTLIVHSAFPEWKESLRALQASSTTSLPPPEVLGKVLHRFTTSLLPDLPFISGIMLSHNLKAAFDEHDARQQYSAFLIASITASTALHMSPSCLSSALPLYYFAVTRLIAIDETQMADPLWELEAVIALTQFARLASRCGNQEPTPEHMPTLPDFWALSGIAVRIAVDLGLHKSVRNARESALLRCAVELDKMAALAGGGLPVGIPEAVIVETTHQNADKSYH
ncbi:hypothetical protein GQ53DRAFT_519317 [Thozetella sp. PMI_491]|nr:hypothetical protein GQ53DRAFT_519317 [Thozetella sp. PMI_491]